MSHSVPNSNSDTIKKKMLLKERILTTFTKKNIMIFSGKLSLVFITSFLIFFWLTHSQFSDNAFLKQTSRVTLNFIKTWEDKLPSYVTEIFYSDIKPTQQEELLNYKLTMISKSLDQYFKNLLVKTQEQVASTSLLSFIQDEKNYYNYYKTKRDLQKHLEHNRDILEFSLYKLNGTRIVTLKHKNIPDYFISSELLNRVSEKNNLLLKHKNSSNLVLLSSITHQDEQVMVISQTINPVFFTRILNYLEASKELFYLKDSDDFIIVDNYDSKTFHSQKEQASPKDHNFISLYETFVNLHEKNIKIDFDKVEYSLGMVVERNNVWGNIFSVLTLVFIIFISKIAIDVLFKLFLSTGHTLQKIVPYFQLKNFKNEGSSKNFNYNEPELAVATPTSRSTSHTNPTDDVENSSINSVNQKYWDSNISKFAPPRTIAKSSSHTKNNHEKNSHNLNSPIIQKFTIEPETPISDIPPFIVPPNNNKPNPSDNAHDSTNKDKETSLPI